MPLRRPFYALAFLPLLSLPARAQDTPAILTAPASPATILHSFDSDADLATLQVSGGQMHLENGVLKLQLEPGEGWPQINSQASQPLDWSGKSLGMDVKNAGENPVEIGIRVDDDVSSDGWKHSWTTRITLAPGETQKIAFELGADPMQFGMRALPSSKGIEGFKTLTGEGDKPLDAAHITSWQLFVHAPKTAVPLEIDNIALLPASSSDLKGIIDEFGQYARTDWPGKLHLPEDLIARRDAEKIELSAPQTPILTEEFDRFGGWKNGPQQNATGFFRTQNLDGKWWLVDPDGHLFFSIGVDVVQPANETVIAGRETMFQKIPDATDALGRFRGQAQNVLRGPAKEGLTYDFTRANLYRKYGDDWPAQFNRVAIERLKNWGFNTIGNWSSNEVKAGVGDLRLPYVATSGIYGDHARLSDGDDYWGQMHDPFDPKFEGDAGRALQEIREKVGDDPFCLGYFVENELSWGNGQSPDPKRYFGLVYGTLSAPITQPAKAVLVAQLRKKYPGIGLLNKAWGTKFPGWEALSPPFQAPDTPNDAMKADFSAFLSLLAEKYFATVSAQLKKIAPHHLYLGSRFSGRPPLEVSKASAATCDVVSFNIYAPALDAAEWDFVKDLGKPIIIGEFHVGATDRGMFHPGLVSAPDQSERAKIYANYLESVRNNPNFVGCHWFQYIDEPNTGRVLDGENYNIGLVDVTDTPYAEMVTAAKEINRAIYTPRIGQK